MLISSAYQLIARANLTQEAHTKAIELIGTAIFEVAGGELLDTEAPFRPDNYNPLVIYRYKTAGYSLIAPLLTGAHLSQCATTEDVELLREYATNLGIGYQIKDDVLGLFGETSVTGKSTLGDLREGKQTIIIDEFKDKANAEQRLLFDATFGRPDTSELELEKLKAVIEESGALASTLELEEHYTEKAFEAARSVSNVALKEELLFLIGLLKERRA